MKTEQELLNQLTILGIEIFLNPKNEDSLSFKSPKGVMTEEIKNQLKYHKTNIARLLSKSNGDDPAFANHNFLNPSALKAGYEQEQAKYLDKFPELGLSHLREYLELKERLDSLPVNEQEIFITSILAKLSLLSAKILIKASKRTSEKIGFECIVAVWKSALCDLSPRHIINTLYEATVSGLGDVIDTPIKFHARCKRIHIE